MATLAGSTIASTYTYLLKMDGTSGVTSSLVKVEDGDATDTSLSVSTVAISIDATDKFYLDAGGNTYLHEVSADAVQIVAGGTAVFEVDSNSRISLSNNDGNTSNTVFGYKALTNNGTVLGNVGADYNVAVGDLAMGTGTTTDATYNVAIGYQALLTENPATAADMYNTAVGFHSGLYITTGTENTLIGGLAGDAITTGDNNVLIGSGTSVSAVDGSGANVLGRNVSGEAGYTTLGSGSDDIRAAHGNVTWATVSDQRYKKDIVDSTAGLAFVNALQPRTFKYKTLGELPETFRAYEADSTEAYKNSDTNHGFIAQEVKAAIDADSSIKDGFRLWDDREDGSQEVAEAALIPILVKAIQEQQTLIESLTARITTLEG